MQRDEAHALPDPAEHPLDDRVTHLAMGGMASPKEHVGFGELPFR